MTDEVLRQIYRARWWRAREAVNLVDVSRDDFGTGGLGRHVPHLSVRLVVLPADPETDCIEFDKQLWTWLKRDHEQPFEGSATDWGHHVVPTTAAAVRCLPLSAERWSWDAYFAVCRHGGFDMSLGPDGGSEHNGERVFWLVRIVGRIWAALHLYREFTTQFEVKGPWECSVALRKTSGAALGNFGTGWVEYGDPFANARPCPEPNLLWRRELDTWPASEEAQQLAFAIGAWIEDSFGSQNRRFLAHQGPFAGKFDLSKYR